MAESPLPDELTDELTDELIAGYVARNLDSEELKAFEQLLADNPHLEAEVQHYQATLAKLAHTTLATPPPHLRAAILDTASAPFNAPARIPARRSPVRKIVTAGIPFLLTLGFGFYSYYLRQELTALEAQVVYQKDTIAMLQQSSTNLVSLRGMDMAPSASGNVVITPGEQQAVLVFRNLPALSQGQAYYLWAEIDGKKVACGQFHPNSQGTVLTKLHVPTSKIQALIVTIEASSSPSEPTGPMVMTSGV